MLGLLISCVKKPEVVEITETREVTAIDEKVSLNVSSEERLGGAMPSRFDYVKPEGWTKVPPTQFRLLNFQFGHGGEAYVSVSGGGLLQNTNRWLKQFGKKELDDTGLGLLPRVAVLKGQGLLVKAEGRFGGGMGKAAADDWGLLGVLAPMEDQILTVKMTGPQDEVSAQREAFLEFCRKLKWRVE